MNEKGVAEFSRYVAGAPASLFYVLADVVEEDFFQENIPYVRGADRRALLARKLAQRYRDASLALVRDPRGTARGTDSLHVVYQHASIPALAGGPALERGLSGRRVLGGARG